MRVDEIISKTDKGYVLYSKSKGKSGKRKKLGGPYKSRDAAEKREREVQYFKHASESVEENVNYSVFEPGFSKKAKIKIKSGDAVLYAKAMSSNIAPQLNIIVKVDGKQIANARFVAIDRRPSNKLINKQKDDSHVVAGNIRVDNEYQRQGVASAIYDFVHSLGNEIRPSSSQTADAKAFWKSMSEGTRCWKGYEKRGMKTHYGKRVPNCVKKEEKEHKLLDKPTPSIRELADKHGVDTKDIMRELVKGIKVELEHTSDPKIAREIALDHINELPDYYTRLAKVEENLIEEASKLDSSQAQIDMTLKLYTKELNKLLRANPSGRRHWDESKADVGEGNKSQLGIPANATKAELEAIRSKGGKAGRRAHWLLNMRKGNKKK